MEAPSLPGLASASASDSGTPEGGAEPAPPRAEASFTRNDGQLNDPAILFYARQGGVLAGFGQGFVRYVITQGPAPSRDPTADLSGAPEVTALVTVSFGDDRTGAPLPRDPVAGVRNFFIGSDAGAWTTGVRSYGTLAYDDAWPGVDLVWRATSEGPKYEVVAGPGADLSLVSFTYEGSGALSITPEGALVAPTGAGPLTDSPPVASSAGSPLSCSFALLRPDRVGFSCPTWDGGSTLVVDPLVTSTYLGGSSYDYGWSVQVGPDGSIYVGGYTQSSDFPTTAGAYRSSIAGGYDQFISKFDYTGTTLLWSTFIGGSSTDYGYDLAVDSTGDAYIVGYSSSSNYPTTAGAFDSSNNGSYDATVAKIDVNGATLELATYVGGSSQDYGRGVALGANGVIYIGGETYSSNFVSTGGVVQPSRSGYYDQFVTALNATGALVASTYLGGTSYDYGWALRTNASGLPVIVGYSSSSNYPTTAGSFQPSNYGGYDAVLAVLSADLSSLVYSTYIGGSSTDYAYGLAIHSNVAYVTGSTYSSNFPTTGGAFGQSVSGYYDAYLVELDLGSGDLDYGSYFGGSSYDYGRGVAVNSLGEATLTGYTQSGNFPVTTYRDQETIGGSYDAFILRLASDGASLVYSSLLGGSSTDEGYAVAVDSNGTAYFTGETYSSNFPTTTNAYDSSYSRYYDSFLVKIEMRKPRLTMTTSPPGLNLFNQNDNVTTPFSEECTTLRRVSAPSPQYFGDVRYVFDSWSDDGTVLHSVDCSVGDISLVAYFHTEFLANFTTSPPGLQLTIDSAQRTTPTSSWWVNGTNHRVSTIDLYTSGNVRYTFDHWDDGNTTYPPGEFDYVANQSLELRAVYTISQYFFQAHTDRPGTYITLDGNQYDGPVAEWLDAGSTHTLSAPDVVTEGPDVRHTFDQWSDGGALSRSFNMTSPLDLVARYTTEYYTRIETDPSGISIEMDGAELATPYAAWWPENTSHRLKGPFDLVEVGDTRYQLTGWVDSYAAERTVYADGPITYTALFTPASYRTSLDAVPTGLSIIVDRETYTTPVVLWWDVNTEHVVQAISPQEGVGERYVFSGWSDHLQVTHVVTSAAPLELTARYTTEYEVVVDTEPTGLQVSVDGVGGTSPLTVWWVDGERHDIGVEPTQSVGASERWEFDAWSDAGDRLHAVAATEPTTFVATFAPTFLLTLESAHGAPPCDVADCWYRGGTTATFSVETPLEASKGVRFAFSAWTGDYSSSEAEASVVMDGPKTVTAIWVLEYELTVASEYGNATGAGWYPQGESAAVAIEPTEWTEAGVGYAFSGWTGASSSQAAQTTVAMDGPKTVSAVWDPVDTGPDGGAGGDGGGGGQPAQDAGSGVDMTLVGGGVAGAAVAAVLGLLVLRRRRPEEGGEGEIAAPAEAPPAPPEDVQVSVPAAPSPAGRAAAGSVAAGAAAAGTASAGTASAVGAAAKRPLRKQPAPSRPKAPVREAPVRKAPAVPPKGAPPSEEKPAPKAAVDLKCHSCGEPVEAGWSVCPFCEALLVK